MGERDLVEVLGCQRVTPTARVRVVLGLISKLAGTHRYHLTQAGRVVITAIRTALRASVRQLTAAAA